MDVRRFTLILSVLIAIGVLVLVQKHSIEKRVIKDSDGLLEPITGDKDNPDAAYRFRHVMLAGREHNLDLPQMRRNAISCTKQTIVQSKNLMKASTPFWSALSPGNIGGRVRSIVIHPTNSSIISSGSMSGSIWNTTNGGLLWSPKTDAAGILPISSMLIDTDSLSTFRKSPGANHSISHVRTQGLFKEIAKRGARRGNSNARNFRSPVGEWWERLYCSNFPLAREPLCPTQHANGSTN